MRNTALAYRVEGHGSDTLRMFGGTLRSYGFTREPLLTRENAWQIVKDLQITNEIHTIKVFKNGKQVYKICRCGKPDPADRNVGWQVVTF